jgi:hypothetical protein
MRAKVARRSSWPPRAVRWMTCKWNWGCEMGPLHEEARWFSDGDGMRCYFSERDRRGPSRLECYRRLLAKPDDIKQGGYRSLDLLLACAPLQRFAAWLELGRKNWRDWSAVHLIWGRHAADRRPRAGDAPFELDDGFNAAVAEAPLAARFTSDFESDLSRPLRLNLDEWRRRSPLERAREKFRSMFGEVF